MFPFVALARIMMLRNMMFLAREHIFTATQPDVSYTRRHVGATQHDPRTISASRMKKIIWGVLAEIPEIFNLGTTWEHLYINGTLKRKTIEKPSDDDDFLIKHNFFWIKTKKTEFRKILTMSVACKHLIYNGRHLEWQCIISKIKLNTCPAIEGRCTLVVP